MAKEVRHAFTVEQFGATYHNFPVDMLRTDQCFPATEHDSVSIASSFNLRRKYGNVGPVKLTRYAHKQWVPNKDRWMSFGWDVIAEGRVD